MTASSTASQGGHVSHDASLAKRYDAIEAKLTALEANSSRRSGIAARQDAIEQRLAALEAKLGLTGPPAQACAHHRVNAAVGSASAAPVPDGESDTYRRLHGELCKRGIYDFRFVRVTGPYYDQPLEFRAERVGAASKHHMCKTMVMENTRLADDAEAEALGSAACARRYLVLVQYSASIDANKLKLFAHRKAVEARPGFPKSQINMRMVAEEVAQELTGYGHNAVTPILSETRMPIVMSHKIAGLPGLFFLGAGEVDLKVGIMPKAFLEGFADAPVFVVNCTS